jgi:hypothetical protein
MRRRRSILGPILLITIGVLFALDYIAGKWSFWSETWPVILVVIGIVKLAERMMWDDHAFYYNNGPRPWGPGAGPGGPATPGAVPPPPPGAPGATPPTVNTSSAAGDSASVTEYPAYPTYPPAYPPAGGSNPASGSSPSGESGGSHAS